MITTMPVKCTTTPKAKDGVEAAVSGRFTNSIASKTYLLLFAYPSKTFPARATTRRRSGRIYSHRWPLYMHHSVEPESESEVGESIYSDQRGSVKHGKISVLM
jgi:hypothetical protein